MSNLSGSEPDVERHSNDHSFPWGILVIGLVAGLIGMKVFVSDPVLKELQSMKREMASIQIEMQDLVGTKHEVWETNNLLSALQTQSRYLKNADDSLQVLRKLRIGLEAEGIKSAKAIASVESLQQLQNNILDQADFTESAAESLAQMVSTQDQLVTEHATTVRAQAALNEFCDFKTRIQDEAEGLDKADEALAGFGLLKESVLNQSKDLAKAQQGFTQFVDLKNFIQQESDDVAEATQSTGKLLALKESIVLRGGNTESARKTSERLLGLRDQLIDQEQKTKTAQVSLDHLVSLQKQLTENSDQIVDAIQSFEILTNLYDQLQMQVKSVSGLRRDLMEIVLMESTISRAMKILEPLVQLSDLRRLSQSEIRDAARTVMESRSSRLSQRQVPIRRIPLNSNEVKLPREESLFKDINSNVTDRLAPLPPADEE